MSSARYIRVGQIVPSSNTTMETEIPMMFRRREEILPERFTFHSSRMRMKKVTKEELAAMDKESLRCAAELADARMDVMGYACLVAIMSTGLGYHRESEKKLGMVAEENDGPAPIVTSAGALVDGLHVLGAKKIAVIAPYMRSLTDVVIEYIEHEGIQVVDSIALEIPDNLEVGARDPLALIEIAEKLDIREADAVVISACVQMPSFEAVHIIEDKIGKPVVSSAVCTTYKMLRALDLEAKVPDAGSLLSGRF